ncbi:alpha/beta fold hydrolase [Levilactobacillus brevis]|jgi:uncharacterized alpha/beta hydrolase family protein|uniref:Alpha/beta hydrolase superfamily protein n=1 Tax=Levilactobacillus brevis (strain ATCC 367 / BCRC 12310 / CIP 105137 / JCM 1170 / LMG 11437 / NCIMB 947 / NCTC 947) TaxID=387344 RepID=Q03TE6_LEVBA|nr:alpha/beta fold hydrolase [Levilactobacillus brevis]ABJ63526.1 alpha/beta hydrolase superfamily protein [Levilactobacillus brevis ATCC 367]ARW49864.1 hypothetical protein S101106_00337 [Levilactobacillus brevis]KLE29946.1 amidohydrolase [Levilactobacillus brevis]KWT51766.1 amidohydrolase [Levilactobacillus brevis]KWU36662.1 amidohydrolase [Levilactobacillus brevis]
MRKFLLKSGLIGVGAWWSYRWLSQRTAVKVPLNHRRTGVPYTTTPTLFIPGWGGNAWTYNGLLRWLARHGYGHQVMTIVVDRRGQLRVQGDWSMQADNPLIQVLFAHPFTRDYQQQIAWLTTVLRELKSHTQVATYNMVAHSWGGSAAVNQLVRQGGTTDLPRLNRLVLLGAPVNEATPTKPDAMYERLTATKQNLTAITPGIIHNVYGLLAGRLTDGEVPVHQITALRAVVRNSPLQYREHPVPGIGHGRLHSAPQMWQLIAHLLWSPDQGFN